MQSYSDASVSDLPETNETAASPSRCSRRQRVLVVEDSKICARITAKILSDFGFDVDLASDGLQAVAASQKKPYDCILMDYEMPGMDGIRATTEWRALEKQSGSRTPIIGYSASIDGSRCLAGGMDDHMRKPASPEALRTMLNFWVGREQRTAVHS